MGLKDLLDGLAIPIVQAPMLGASGAAMAVSVCEAGGLGFLAAGALPAAEIGRAVAEVRAGTGAPFGVNLLVTRPVTADPTEVDRALARLAPWYAAVGAPVPAAPNQFAPDFKAQFRAVVQAAPAVASFAFDELERGQVEALRAAGVLVIGTATTVAEARAWAEAGADGICAQGSEAGGHRGHFLAEAEASLVGTMALVATIRQACGLPVIAAGGIMDGRGVAAALALGASAAQMGTAFLLSDQATTGAPWRAALQAADDDPTRLTRAITGRHARGLETRFMREMRSVENDVPAYPVQNRLTQPLREAAARAGDAEVLSLWAGQAVKLIGRGDAGDLVRRWWREAGEAAAETAQRTGR
jgi:nitronate monooxygenase